VAERKKKKTKSLGYKQPQDAALSVVAIKQGQKVVSAPTGHTEWTTVKCDRCAAVFWIAKPMVQVFKQEHEYVRLLKETLAVEHTGKQQHQNCYVLGD
jgi:hypothetical protein